MEPVSVTTVEEQKFTNDGRRLYQFGVNVKPVSSPSIVSRALFSELAHTFDYFEVVFKISATEFRTRAARLPNQLRISIPQGNYPVGTGCVLLAGMYNGGKPVLLAVGEIDNEDVSPTNPTIGFTLYSLKSDVLDDPSPSFEITAPSTGTTQKLANYNDQTVPYWTGIAVDADPIEATLTISATQGLTGVVPTSGTGAPVPAGFIIPKNFSGDSGDVLGLEEAYFGTFDVSLGSASDTEFPINFSIENGSGTRNGLFMLNFEFPVMGLDGTFTAANASKTGGKVWWVRNGLRLEDFDLGKDLSSLGSGLLIEVGSSGIDQYIVTVGP
jgi:hypothetical protein